MKKIYICIGNCDNSDSIDEIDEEMCKQGYPLNFWILKKYQFFKDKIYTYYTSDRHSNVIYLGENDYHGYVTHNFIKNNFVEYDELLIEIDVLFDTYFNKW